MQRIELNSLFALIGTFWAKLTASTTLTKRLFAAALYLHRQSEQKVTELVRSISNKDISAGQTTILEKLVFIANQFPGLSYGEPQAKYGYNYFYGDVLDNKAIYTLAENIISIPMLCDDPIEPTKIYTENVDYVIEPGKITFKEPFDSDTTVLYGKYILRDTGFIYRQLSYVLGINLSDRLFRKIPLKELWRLYTYGPNYYNVLQILALCADAPIIKSPVELVENIFYIAEGGIVVTDKEAYFVPLNRTITVAVGALLTQGTSISSGLQILHDKLPVADNSLPDYMRINGYLLYGSRVVNPARTVLIKADIHGEVALALQYFAHIMPLDTKIVLLTNIQVPKINVESTLISVSNNQTLSVRAPNYATQNLQIVPKCEFRLKYSA